MTTCASCGHANEPGASFCGSCSGYLAWSDTSSQLPATAQVGAGALPSAGSAAQPSAGGVPAARPPEAEQGRPTPQRGPGAAPSDVWCGACGSGNAEGRRFCRQCGGLLEDPEPAARVSWWRRAWGWVRTKVFRRHSPLAAGQRPASWQQTRPKGRRRWRPRFPHRLSLGKLALPLCILSLFGLGIGPLRVELTQRGFAAWNAVERKVNPTYVNVSAARATATSSARGHRAASAVDQNTGTWWAAGEPVAKTGARLDVSYAQSVDVVKVAFRNGAQGKQFAAAPRVRTVRLVLSGPGAVTVEEEIELADRSDLQDFDVKAKDVRRVALHVLSVYPGQRNRATALTEFQLVKVE